jgi:hypothetical protein
VPAGLTTDFDGNSRIYDGNLNNVAIVDMGAYEAVFRIFGPFIRR